ncbi:MAG: hypothetical protein JNL60_11615 [Bacteroidia bacterium]|nr:hypothetical protein [Bacteroidia bacterium]
MYKKFTFLLLLSSLLALNLKAQTAPSYFEGQVVYNNTYKSKDPKITDKRFAAMFGSTHNYFVDKNGNYRTETNGMFAQWQMYLSADNKIYNKMTYTDTVFWNSGLDYDDQVLNVSVKKHALKILGYDCDELVLTCRSGVQKYYYSSKLAIDPEKYKNHLFANYYNYVSRAKALPLKMIIEDQGFIMESTVTSVTYKPLAKDFFKLAPGTKLLKSQY